MPPTPNLCYCKSPFNTYTWNWASGPISLISHMTHGPSWQLPVGLPASGLWKFLNFAKIKVNPSSSVLPPPPQLKDGALTKNVLAAQLPCSTILAINCCHITHQVLYWSNVANGWGDSISESLLHPPTATPSSCWSWPPESPSHFDWHLWVSFLHNSPYTSDGHFLQPLGSWSSPAHCCDFVPFDP